MKFVTINGNYISPNPTKGMFPNAYIKDFKKVIEDKSLIIYFGLYWIKNDQEVQVDETSLLFDENFETGYIGLGEKKTESEDEQPIFEQSKPLFEFVENGGDVSKGVIMNMGYPSHAIVKSFFNGGSLNSPEIHLADNNLKDIAKDFFLNMISFEGEAIGKQFKFEAI